MIYYFVTERQTTAMQSFLSSWGSALADRTRIITYESVLAGHEVPQRGNYIFTNLNWLRTRPQQVQSMIRGLHDRLVEQNGAHRVLNNPARALSRFELLRALHVRGINDFNVYRIGGAEAPRRYPVFIRNETGPTQETPRPLNNAAEYEATVRGINWSHRGAAEGLIAVEYCDTSDATGIYRKYAAFIVGGRVIPRHLLFSRNWMVRLPDIVEPWMADEELAYMIENPHAEALLACANLACISYGRFDYALKDGRPQFWEINTNSTITIAMGRVNSSRDEVQKQFVPVFIEALEALDRNGI